MDSSDPILLTPGPLTTAPATREAMQRDWGSWDGAFNAITATIQRDLLDIVHAADTHVCVPLQGSGTFAVEAALANLVPRTGRVLVPVNGAYCRRIVRILEYLGRAHLVIDFGENQPVAAAVIEAALAVDRSITHVALVHCETSTGILNPLADIAAAVAQHGRGLIVDAMSSFGALPIDARRMPFTALVSASGKCLEGVPGMGFVIAERAALAESAGNSHSLALDLHDQWQYLERTGQWRFTPPTHVVAALRAALDALHAEGGPSARLARYRANCATLVSGMQALGLEPFLDARVQAPIIVTFGAPADSAYDFAQLYQRVRARGFILYPGKLTRVDTFRVGCIGAIDTQHMRSAVQAIGAVLDAMGVRNRASAPPRAA